MVDVCESPPGCSTPFDTATTNTYGDVTLTIPTPGKGFAGALRLSAPGFITLYYSVYPPAIDASNPWYPDPNHEQVIYSPETFRNRFVVEYDSTKSSITVGTADCNGIYSGDVRVTIDDGQPPTVGATSSTFFLNVAPGPHRVVAALAATGQELAAVDVIVPQGEMVAVHLGPIPTAP